MARQRNNVSSREVDSRPRGRNDARRMRSGSYSDEQMAHADSTAFSAYDNRTSSSYRASGSARTSRQVLWSEQFASRNAQASGKRARGNVQGTSQRARSRSREAGLMRETESRESRRTRASVSESKPTREGGLNLMRRFRSQANNRESNRAESSRKASTSRARAYEAESLREERREEGVREQRREDSRSKRRRERTKARADKMFDRQFAAEATSASARDAGPRAAVYTGKMGSTHRKSTRMQQSASAGAAGDFVARLNLAGFLAKLPITGRTLRAATAVICAVLVCVTMYTPAQQYYQALRERDQLAAEYSIVAERNETLDVQNDVLASDAGMEDAVRQKYGYVKAGEETAVVTGLSEQAGDGSRGNDGIEPTILSSAVKAPEEWYTPFLDAFFGIG